jgi:hypothetical protein
LIESVDLTKEPTECGQVLADPAAEICNSSRPGSTPYQLVQNYALSIVPQRIENLRIPTCSDIVPVRVAEGIASLRHGSVFRASVRRPDHWQLGERTLCIAW